MYGVLSAAQFDHSLYKSKLQLQAASTIDQLPSVHLEADPEAWTIIQTFRDTRELGEGDLLEAKLGLFASGDSSLPQNGPTNILQMRIQRLGWAVGTNGLVQDRYGTFSLLQVGWDELWLCVALSWSHVLCQEVAHRSTFQGLESADILESQSVLSNFSSADQVYLRCALGWDVVYPKWSSTFSDRQ